MKPAPSRAPAPALTIPLGGWGGVAKLFIAPDAGSVVLTLIVESGLTNMKRSQAISTGNADAIADQLREAASVARDMAASVA